MLRGVRWGGPEPRRPVSQGQGQEGRREDLRLRLQAPSVHTPSVRTSVTPSVHTFCIHRFTPSVHSSLRDMDMSAKAHVLSHLINDGIMEKVCVRRAKGGVRARGRGVYGVCGWVGAGGRAGGGEGGGG